jgi:hypothetical protein
MMMQVAHAQKSYGMESSAISKMKGSKVIILGTCNNKILIGFLMKPDWQALTSKLQEGNVFLVRRNKYRSWLDRLK